MGDGTVLARREWLAGQKDVWHVRNVALDEAIRTSMME